MDGMFFGRRQFEMGDVGWYGDSQWLGLNGHHQIAILPVDNSGAIGIMETMRSILLLACSDQKTQNTAPAGQLYASERFDLARKLAEAHADRWFIASAKHGLLHPNSIVAPYDRALPNIDDAERGCWSRRVLDQLRPYITDNVQVVCLGDEEYFQEISAWLTARRILVFVPFQHLPKGKRIPWLRQIQPSARRAQDVARLYETLEDPELRRNQLRPFAESSGSMSWPRRGLYIFYHPQERRMLPSKQLRIVRVGTHAVSAGSRSTLWQRLRSHRGSGDRSGNHRGSVFRLHIGAAFIGRDKLECPSWGIGESADKNTREIEFEIEREVSDYVRSMAVLCLQIDDPPSKMSDRAYLEQNIIALLSGAAGPVDFASESWLGYHCPNAAVQRSSMWNVDYTDREYDPDFFRVLRSYVEVTVGRMKCPTQPLAPQFWREAARTGYRQKTLNLD